jgi:hypothetical protein
MTDFSSPRKRDGNSRPKRKLTIDQGLATVVAAFILAVGGIVGVIAGRATKHSVTAGPTVFVTVTASPGRSNGSSPTPLSSSAPNGVWTVYYQTPVGINDIGINFDNNPPSSASADITFNGSLSAQTPTILAVWPGSATPTAALCENWVTTHPSNFVSTVTVGMRICLKTAQGRPGLLRIQSITSDVPTTANVLATVWQSHS